MLIGNANSAFFKPLLSAVYHDYVMCYGRYTFAQEVVSLYAGVNGYLDKIKLEDIALYEKNMQQHLQEEGIKVLDHLRKTNELTFQVEKELSVFISNFTKDFIENLGYDKSEKN